jgi:hypothetical protein
MALFCSVMCHKTSISLMTTYLLIILLFALPLAIRFFAATFFPDAAATAWIDELTFTSPFATAFALTIDTQLPRDKFIPPNWNFFLFFELFYLSLDALLLTIIARLFNTRWRME